MVEPARPRARRHRSRRSSETRSRRAVPADRRPAHRPGRRLRGARRASCGAAATSRAGSSRRTASAWGRAWRLTRLRCALDRAPPPVRHVPGGQPVARRPDLARGRARAARPSLDGDRDRADRPRPAAPRRAPLRAARQDLRARGARLAVDLAGSDYAGLRELMMVAPGHRSSSTAALVHRVHVDPVKTALVGALVAYGRELGIIICAEGVEDLEDVERLADLDVELRPGLRHRPPGPPVGRHRPRGRAAVHLLRRGVGDRRAPSRTASRVDGRLQWLSWRLSEATQLRRSSGGGIEAIRPSSARTRP